MVVECIAIILIITAIAVVFLRTRRKNYALAVLPIAAVPMLHLLAEYLASGAFPLLNLNRPEIFISAADACALAIAGILLGLMSNCITSKKSRNTYLIVSGGFITVLVWIFISNTLK